MLRYHVVNEAPEFSVELFQNWAPVAYSRFLIVALAFRSLYNYGTDLPLLRQQEFVAQKK